MLTMDELTALNELKTALVDLKTQMARNSNNNRSSAIVQSSGPMWVCVVCVVGLAAYLLAKEGNRSDALVTMQTQISNLQAEARDLRNTDNAIRAYINTGRMPTNKEPKK